MSDLLALYKAVCANPDEDTPRLAFADFLQEQGGKENAFRADYIRAAVRLAREEPYTPGSHEAGEAYFKLHRRVTDRQQNGTLDWVKHLKSRAVAFDWDRGFIGHITVYAKRFVAEAERFFAEDPIRSVRFVTLASSRGSVPIPELFANPHLARVSKLGLDNSDLTDANLNTVGKSPHLAGLRAVSLSGNQRFTPRALVKLLQDLPAVSELLMPLSHHFDDRFAEALAASPVLAKLTVLNVEQHALTPKGVTALLTTKHGANLRELHLDLGYEYDEEHGHTGDQRRFTKKEGKAVADVLGKCRFPDLRFLDLSSCRIGDAGLMTLASGKGFPALRRLRVVDNDLTVGGMKLLADSPLGRQLVRLDVGGDWLFDPKETKAVKAMFPNAFSVG